MAETPATPITNEIATTGDGRDITRPWVSALMPLPTEDLVLMQRGGGDFRLYDEVWRDDHVKAAVEQRRRAVISRTWEVRPGGKRAIDKAAADFLRENLDAIGWDTVCDKMLMGIFYGFAVSECLWAADGRYWRLDAIKVRNRRRFCYGGDGQLRLRTWAQPFGELLPERKFWAFSAGADHDDAPYGLGLAHWLYWPVWFKRNGFRFWAVYLEKFGTPATHGTYPASASQADQDLLLSALKALRQDSAVITPEGMAISLLEATRSGTADYAAFTEAMNKAILVAAIGQTGTTSGTPGKLGSEQEQGEVRMDIVRADADLLSASFNSSVAHWLTEWNFPGAAVPGIWRVIDEPDDLKVKSDRDKNIFTMGYKPTLKYVTETYGGEWEDKPAPMIPRGLADPNAATDPAAAAQFADPAAPTFTPQQQVIEAGIANTLPGLKSPIDGTLIRDAIASASSPADLEDKLAVLLAGADAADFRRVTEHAMFAASLLGYVDAG
jgi:phage gp29-like protein